jgi:hypothetical protein
MRHRIAPYTGLGNPEPAQLMNQGKLNNEFADDALKTYFEDSGFDFQVTDDAVVIGIEPSYQYDRMLIISINKEKNKSFMERGKAWGPYGSQVAKNTTVYADHKKKGKFVKFVDKWHQILFG